MSIATRSELPDGTPAPDHVRVPGEQHGRQAWRRRGAAVGGGLVMALAFPPFDWALLAVPGMALLLWSWRDARPAVAARLGFLSGLVFFLVVMEWLRYFGVIAMGPLLALLAAYWALAGALVAWLARRGLRSPWLIGAVWVFTEAFRGRWPFGGLTWGELGYSFHDLGPARDLARWGSVRLVTYLAVVAAAILVDLAVRRSGTQIGAATTWRRRGGVLGIGGMVVAAVLAPLLEPGVRQTGSIRVAAVQGNDINRDLSIQEIRAHTLSSRHFALADGLGAGEGIDLVVFPESSMDADPLLDAFVADGIARTARRLDAHVIANHSSVARPDGRRENTNFFFDPDARLIGTYMKQHLVPFGEYLPLRSIFGRIGATEQIGRDTAPGRNRFLTSISGVPVATMICFESAFSEIARANVRDGAEILVVTTNNRSYRRSANSDQHIAMTQFRAAETGRPIVHSSISGSTAIIDADGRVTRQSELFVNGVTVADVTGATGRTPYVVLGDWVVYASMLAVWSAGMVAIRRARRARTIEAATGDGTG